MPAPLRQVARRANAVRFNCNRQSSRPASERTTRRSSLYGTLRLGTCRPTPALPGIPGTGIISLRSGYSPERGGSPADQPASACTSRRWRSCGVSFQWLWRSLLLGVARELTRRCKPSLRHVLARKRCCTTRLILWFGSDRLKPLKRCWRVGRARNCQLGCHYGEAAIRKAAHRIGRLERPDVWRRLAAPGAVNVGRSAQADVTGSTSCETIS